MTTSNILKPNSASRRWRANRKPESAPTFNAARAPYVNERHSAERGKHAKPKEHYVFKPYSVTDEAKKAYEANELDAHIFHAALSIHGTFGRSPQNRNPLTVAQRKALAEKAPAP